MKRMSILLFGFLMSIGWYAAKIIMVLINDAIDKALYRRNSRKLIRSKYIK